MHPKFGAFLICRWLEASCIRQMLKWTGFVTCLHSPKPWTELNKVKYNPHYIKYSLTCSKDKHGLFQPQCGELLAKTIEI